MQHQANTVEWTRVKKLVLLAFLFWIFGTGTELYLLKHFEDIQQLIPLLIIGTSLVLLATISFLKSPFLTRVFQALMGVSVCSGLYGTFLHLRANYEFELEMKPTLTGWELFAESLSGALPALAPGSMIVFALIGYSYTKLLKQEK